MAVNKERVDTVGEVVHARSQSCVIITSLGAGLVSHQAGAGVVGEWLYGVRDNGLFGDAASIRVRNVGWEQ